jgi:(5-formylfuran-3-yl)methyl phosphate synthase
MNPSRFIRNSPGLLVSVRSAAEAVAAHTGGADVIDVKEPNRGPLGAADPNTMAEILRVAAGRVLVTAAAGELLDTGPGGATRIVESLPNGISLYKIGLHGCRDVPGWDKLWSQAVARGRAQVNPAGPVAVVYADWLTARAPAPLEVLRIAIEIGCPALLIDTWDKCAGNLFEHWSLGQLNRFIAQVRSRHMAVVLAGSLSGSRLTAAARLAPDLVAVRAAACENGRGGTIVAERVAALKQMITTAGTQSSTAAPVSI